MASVVLDDGNFAGSVNQNVLVAAGAKLGGAGLTTYGSVVSNGATVNGDETINGSLLVIQPNSGVSAATISDEPSGVAPTRNSLSVVLNLGASPTLAFTDSGFGGILGFEGTTAPSGAFFFDRVVQHPLNLQCGRADAQASGASFSVQGMTATSLVLVTQQTNGAETSVGFLVTPGTDAFTVSWAGGGNASFTWFVARL